MNIVMLEPLGVSEDVMRAHMKALTDAGHTFTFCGAPLSREEKLARAKDADVFIIANGKLDRDVIGQAKNLKFISVGFTGVDHVDLDACKENGVAVSNASGYATDSTAELALSMILGAYRHLVVYDGIVRAGGTLKGYTHHTLKGKTVGIVGTGAIGLRLVELLKPFGCTILGYSRSESARAKALGVTYVSLDTLMRESDVVSLHVPLTRQTRGLIDAEKIALMKKDSILVNCARGAVVDSAALAAALNEERIAAAAIDVYETEPPIAEDHPLLHAKNAILTPHVGFFSEESLAVRAKIVCENVAAFIGGAQINVIL